MSKKRLERKKKRLEKEKLEDIKKFSKVFYLKKKVSETPLEMLEKFKKSWKFFFWKKQVNKNNKSFNHIKIPLAYAGRLDPMAEGKMLILAGEACKEGEKYLNLNKEYSFEVLIGFQSDSKDILGIIKKKEFEVVVQNKNIQNILNKMLGKREMKYPIFSSKTVNGKPLFLWALEERINEIKIPSKKVEIFSINLEKIYWKKKDVIKKEIFKKINSLKKVEMESKKLGENFRRVEILKSWEEALIDFPSSKKFLILKIKTKVSSGTYIRNLAQEIGENLGNTGLAYSIKRTKFLF